MCGIFGYIGEIPKSQSHVAWKFLRQLFIGCQTRGRQASGFAAINYKTNKVITDKRNITAEKFVERCDKFLAFRRSMPNVFIGHTRMPTGNAPPKRNRNNHPFLSKRLALVHNGSVKEHDKVAKELELDLRSQTDSEVLLRILDKSGNFADGAQQIIDANSDNSKFAIAFVNHGELKERGLHIFRNSKVPCHMVYIDNWQAVFFASTAEIIRKAFDDAYGSKNRALFRGAYEISETQEIKDHVLYSFTHNKGVLNTEKTDLKKRVIVQTKSQTTPSKGVGASPASSDNKKYNKDRVFNASRPTSSSKNEKIEIVTESEMAGLSEESQKEVREIEHLANRTLKIVRSIQQNPYMTEEEWDEFSIWKTIV